MKLKIYVTPLWYNSPSYFVEKIKTLTTVYAGKLDKMCVSIDYTFYKPELSESSVKRIEALTKIFKKVIIEHAEGVNVSKMKDQLEILNIEIYQGRAPESAWKFI